jgi:hypothetical protein
MDPTRNINGIDSDPVSCQLDSPLSEHELTRSCFIWLTARCVEVHCFRFIMHVMNVLFR